MNTRLAELGRKATADLIQRLTGTAAELAQITPPDGKPEGWDAADATPEEARQLLAAAQAPAPALPYGFKRKNGVSGIRTRQTNRSGNIGSVPIWRSPP